MDLLLLRSERRRAAGWRDADAVPAGTVDGLLHQTRCFGGFDEFAQSGKPI